MKTVALPNHRQLRVWDRLTILIGEGHRIGRYAARVEEFLNDGIIISRPEFISGGTLLRKNVDVTVQVNCEDGVYEFDSHLRLHESDRSTHAFLRPPRSVRRVQRRQFVRLELSMPVDYAVLTSSALAGENPEPLQWVHTRSVDISAGGILIGVPEPVDEEALVVLRMSDLTPAGVPAMVVGIVRRTDQKNERCVAGIEFLLSENLPLFIPESLLEVLPAQVREFTEGQQDRLSNHLFERQIDLRKKGLL